MESATVRRPPPLPGLIQLGLIGLLLVLAVLAWKLTDVQMAGMDAGPGTDLGSLGFFIGTWVVMMAAMMFPSIAPMVLMFSRIQAGRRERGDAVAGGLATLFVGGYLVSWAAAGLAAYLVFEAGKAVTGDVFSWDNAGPYLAGGVIVAAALYQLTPLKDVCLRHCRSPLMFLLTHSKPGRIGAVRSRQRHRRAPAGDLVCDGTELIRQIRLIRTWRYGARDWDNDDTDGPTCSGSGSTGDAPPSRDFQSSHRHIGHRREGRRRGRRTTSRPARPAPRRRRGSPHDPGRAPARPARAGT